MEAISKNIKLIVAMVLGILLTLMGINRLPAGGAGTALGVIELLLGILAIIAGLIPVFVKSEKMDKAFLLILTLIVPVYYFVLDLLLLCNGAGDGYQIVDWILTILRMVTCIGTIIFAIIYFCSNQASIAKVGQIIAAILLATLVLFFVFSGVTIGGISLTGLIFFVSLAVLSYKFFGPMDILKGGKDSGASSSDNYYNE